MKLLGRRVKDRKILDLIWGFLRAGVMERKLFKPTALGTPQGGIVSPLLANVYLHELDKFMEKYTGLSEYGKAKRRSRGEANFAYFRYADDFVVACNGTREQALALREQLYEFLRSELRLSLSMEKTKVTHLNDGFDFLGFRLVRCLGSRGITTKILIPDEAIQRHLGVLKESLSPTTYEDSVIVKFKALNRIISGWCRYYQYTSKASVQFDRVRHLTYWQVARWLGGKFRLSLKEVLRRYCPDGVYRTDGVALLRHADFSTKRYRRRPSIPNPYTTREVIVREELPDAKPWAGVERRPGMADLRHAVMIRDKFTCQYPGCGVKVTDASAEVDHVIPVRAFKRPGDANSLTNLWTLCAACHKKKTESDRRRESRVR
jgi:RNA-directed DNA polymerase